MSLALLLPAALAALGALLLPLLVHLARRSEQRPTDFAALRWLRQKPRPRHRIRFDERGLLCLRLLLLALVALWLAQPVLHGSASERPWMVVLPGIDPAPLRKEAAGRTELRWLAPGFPSLETPAPDTRVPVASLLRELDANLPAQVALTVVVPAWFDGADGERPRLSRAVDWRVQPRPASAREPFATTRPSVPVIRHAPDRQEAVRYLRAAIESGWFAPPANSATAPVATGRVSAASPDQPLPTDARALIWLAPGDVPASIRRWIANGGIALLDERARIAETIAMTPRWSEPSGVVLVEGGALGRGRVLRLTRPLQPARMPQLLEPDFPERLRGLFTAPMPEPGRVAARDYTPLPGAATYPQAPRDLQPWLALLIASLLVLERWWATHRRRSVAP
ncbi:BatA domain-containing protein [Pseudoxanthomonas beigongshangi]